MAKKLPSLWVGALRSSTLLAALALAGSATLAEEEPVGEVPASSIRAVKLRVAKPHPFYRGSGTTLELLVKHPGGTLVSLNVARSELSGWSDDRGTDLLQSKGRSRRDRSHFLPSVPIDKDRHTLLVTLKTQRTPTRGSRTLKIKGKLVLNVARAMKTHRAPAVELKKGSTFRAGPFQFRIRRVDPPRRPGGGPTLELVSSTDPQELSAVRFHDDGEEVPSRFGGGSSSRVGRRPATHRMKLHLERPAATLTMEVEVLDGMKEVEVPLALEIGVGL